MREVSMHYATARAKRRRTSITLPDVGGRRQGSRSETEIRCLSCSTDPQWILEISLGSLDPQGNLRLVGGFLPRIPLYQTGASRAHHS
jgi:hypothetical protein